MAFDLTKLFSIRKPQEAVTAVEVDSISELQVGENYTSFGKRMCMMTHGSTLTLRVILQRIYNYERRQQLNDENMQRQRRDNIIKEIERKDIDISDTQTRKNGIKQAIDNLGNEIVELKEKILEAKDKNGQINKMSRIKLILGCIILTILTVYLFVFYSSTFYSAFFKNFGASQLSVGAAMFDSQAIPNALNDGFGELLFVLSAPIIFMGLGFALHFFSIQKGYAKYFKIAAIVTVTFIFDCLLASKIDEQIYKQKRLTDWNDLPPYDWTMGITSSDVWTVIFCGFVVYIIWGIVFDMTISAYEDLRSNKTEIGQLEHRLNAKKEQLKAAQVELNELDGHIAKLNIERNTLNESLASKVSYDPYLIKQAFSEFFQGWSTVLGALLMPEDESKTVYEQELNALISIPK